MKVEELLRPFEGGTDYDRPDDRYGLMRWQMADGTVRAAMVPARAKRLPLEARELFSDLQGVGGQLAQVNDRIDELVPQLRDEGVSWSLIGFAIGITGEAARQRWGDLDE